MAILEVTDVSYAYEKKKEILTDVTVNLEVGKMYAILGPSGSGKSTLLSLLGGLDVPSRGQILFDGHEVAKNGGKDYRRNHVSLVFQNYNLIDYMNPIENAALTARREVRPVLRRLGLTEEEMRRNVLKLSGGQQQRVAIARAFASDGEILLADEPTGNLDAETAAEITLLLKESAHRLNKCVVMVTHSDEAAKQADVMFVLKRGQLKQV